MLVYMETKNNKFFNILSLDGGGVRGIFSAHLLDLVHSQLEVDIYNKFDLVVGTSVGSIVAAYVATGKCLTDLVKEFELSCSRIFRSKFCCGGILRSKYNNKELQQFLRANFGELRLGEIEVPLIINAANASTGRVHVFKSPYQKHLRDGDYVRDGDVFLYKAVLASCSAPTYFDPVNLTDGIICDGGIWANNPTMVGYADAINNFKVESDNIRVFSIGTGRASNFFLPSKYWGLLTGWKKTKLVDFVMSVQTQFAENCGTLILGDNYYRINPQIDDWSFDRCANVPTLKSLAKSEFTNHSKQINNFLNSEVQCDETC